MIILTGLRGILEAKRRFDIINLVRISQAGYEYLFWPRGSFSRFSKQLPHRLFATLLVVRVVSVTAMIFICLRAYPELSRPAPYSRRLLHQMLSFGGWITVSNIVVTVDGLSRAIRYCGDAVCGGRSSFFSFPTLIIC